MIIKIKRCLIILTISILCLNFISCDKVEHDTNKSDIIHAEVIEIEKYGHAVLNITTNDFIKAGYNLGDVVSISLNDHNYTMPFYDGYYSNPLQLMLRGTELNEYIAICINYGDFAKVNNIKVGDTAKISMVSKAEMIHIQELYSLKYSNDPDDYIDDTTFTNFRAVTVGRIGQGKLYRIASPINNKNGRAKLSDNFIKSVGVATILNLADSYEDIEENLANIDCQSEYYRYLYENKKVVALDLTGNFYSEEFNSAIAEGFTFLAHSEPPYCIHCTEGKDRTGFAAMLLEALMGATLDEIIDDYMITFYNYYGIDKEKEPIRYQAVLDVNLLEMLSHVTGQSVDNLSKINLESAVTSYLLDAGMKENDILLLKEKLL